LAEIRRDEGIFPAKDATKIFWVSAIPAEARAHLVLVHGYAEHIGRYGHVMDDFASHGLAVHGFDCRGHGKSEGQRGHVKQFAHYLDDLDLVLERVRVAAGDKKVFLLGHSHGALIATKHALTRHPNAAGLILSSPYFRL
jgi:alpha-beta hydrolase superfamily lysophospholipase